MKKQKRILVVRTDRLGDVIMITPIVRELKRFFEGCFVGVLINSSYSSVFENNPNVDLIIQDDLKKESYWRIVNEIRKNKFTHGLLVYPTQRAAYQMFLGGVKKRYLTGTKLYGSLTFMHSVSRNKYKNLKHEADYCMDLARRIGVVAENIQPEIFVTNDNKNNANQFLRQFDVGKDSKKIIFHTGSGNSAPNWTEDKYFQLLQALVAKYNNEDVKILLTAIEMTDDFRKKAVELSPENVLDVANHIKDIRSFIDVISVCDIIFSSSTGPSHIADGLGKRAVTIYCNREMSCSKHWGVLNDKSSSIEVSKEYCDQNCSKDKKICRIENGINIEDVLKHIYF